ncbi:hypothetical protein PHLCEN_2v5799 [Hermanssonia centrifuga]|uniref:Uncharacterized protein n=1 Tax=Hermanssonia centrifuga TaxID=98765 RepID=A0A2R6P1S8_9APHY|nr:hypothetical protein PHLCEN_2v5799 [Hermanssonia centrifuga]
MARMADVKLYGQIGTLYIPEHFENHIDGDLASQGFSLKPIKYSMIWNAACTSSQALSSQKT